MKQNLQNLTIATALFGGLVGAAYGSGGSDHTKDPTAAHAAAPASLSAVGAVRQTARAVISGVGVESGIASTRANRALAALRPRVRKLSDPDALQVAFLAYFRYQQAHPERVRKPYLYFVDYGLGSSTPRGYVFDMKDLKLVEGPFTVAHGRGSAANGRGVPVRFSNREGSAATSLGLYVAQETYAFSGKSGGKSYRSVGLRLAGVSGKYNSRARARGVVVHGAPYVTASRAGRSEGCPAMEQRRAARLIPQIANGGLVFLFSPRDSEWLGSDPWVQPKGA